MPNLTYQLSNNKDGLSYLVVYDETFKPYLVNSEHPSWDEILEGVMVNDDPATLDLIDVGGSIARQFVSERVAYTDNHLYFDGDEIAGELTDHIVKSIKENGEEATKPLLNFLEKVSQNPSDNSRKQLYSFLQKHDFTINEDGDFVGYKGVRRTLSEDNEGDTVYHSLNGGPAIINGVPHTSGPVPQQIGDVVEMPRSSVVDDPKVACSKGLHVANWNYASHFAPVRLAVIVNPRDVVSVPVDSNNEKIRACRYRVWKEITDEFSESVISTGNSHPDQDLWDEAAEDFEDWGSQLFNGEFEEFLVAEYGLKQVDFESPAQRTSWVITW